MIVGNSAFQRAKNVSKDIIDSRITYNFDRETLDFSILFSNIL